MITLYTILVFLHVVGAIIWIGSAVAMEVLEWEAVRAVKRERLRIILSRGEWFGGRVFGPAAMLTVLTGIILVAIGRPAFGSLWIILALIGVVLASLIGAGVVGRTMRDLSKLVSNQSVHEDEIERRFRRMKAYAYADLAILFFILFDMVVKPKGFDSTFFIIVGSYIVVVGFVIWVSQKKKRLYTV